MRSKHPGLLLCGCIMAAFAAVVLLDRQLTKTRKNLAVRFPPANPDLMQAPTLQGWRPVILEAGTKAPTFRLTDVRTGGYVSLEDLHAGRPVVLLLSSFG